ncbi:protein kinase [Halobacterium wangiae]|uniref:protein kinase n=1 Tax=Halobacterium wangiae TaxID=2902623 RepID=UPI001E29CDAD|nr:protein kinase [Halobacterium wangiae]
MEPDTGDRDVDSEHIAALQQQVEADSVDALVDELGSEDPDERAGAAWRLVEAASSEPTAVRAHLDSVLDCVDDDDVWVQRGATWVLAELAERQPDALSVKFEALVDLTRAADPLVRQNGVVAVAGVTKSYPARASAGLSSIAPLTRSEDPLLRRYAKQAVREVTAAIADRAEDAGYPMLVRAHPEFADLFPEGVSVVTVNADDDRSRPVHVSFGQDAPAVAEDDGDERPKMGPPDEVPDPPNVVLEDDDLAPNLKLRQGVLTTDFRADVDEEKLEHGLVTYRRFHRDESAVLKAFHEAVERWAAVDEHDHVVSILGQGDRWLATRYDDGETFERRGAPKTLAEAVYDAMSITKAISYAHARGVVHGGLHPAAVRFVATGRRTWDAPVVGDWGFAHAASGVQVPPVPSGFAAPEHHEPETYGRFDQSTDVFGVGAMTYYLFTGEPPNATDDLVPAREWNPALPEGVEDLFALSLAAEKTARYDTVLDYQRSLDELAVTLAGEGVA